MSSVTNVLFLAFICCLFSSCCSPTVLAAVIQDSLNVNRRVYLHHNNATERVYQRHWLKTHRLTEFEKQGHFTRNSPSATIAAGGITTLLKRQKRRAFQAAEARPACPSISDREYLTSALNDAGTIVEVVQNSSFGLQSFFTHTCSFDRMRASYRSNTCRTCCYGVDSHSYGSKCEQQFSLVNAWVRGSPRDEPDWDFIHVNSGCKCVVSE